ncbi:MAG: HEAT repeat domain-containing protein [Anaerolineae bacterium]
MTDLAAALQEKSAAARWQTLTKLGRANGLKLSDAATLSALTRALADEHPFVRWQAGLALAGQTPGRQKLLEVLKSYPAPLGETPAPDVLCAAAIDALAAQKSSELRGYLPSLLEQGNPLVRQSAAEALNRQGSTEAVPHLNAALRDHDPWVRRAAAVALGHLGDVHAATALIPCLKDKAVVVRRSAAYALGALKAASAVPALRVSLTDRDAQVRRNAAWALGRMGQPEVITDLTLLLADPALDGHVAETAQEAIATLSKSPWQQLLSFLGKRFSRS